MEVLPDNYTVADRDLIMRTYKTASNAHDGQKRISGEPYISHCVAVAAILAEMRVPPVVVVAGLLHDTVEDTALTLVDIRKNFGDEVESLVDGVTKLTHMPRVSRGDQHIEEIIEEEDLLGPEGELLPGSTDGRDRRKDLRNETLRKTFMAMGDDIRVVLVKLRIGQAG